MNAKLEEIFDTLQAKRDEMEAERDTLQHKRDEIGAEIAELNDAMREIDRMLGRSVAGGEKWDEEQGDNRRRRVVRMTSREIRNVPVEHVSPSAEGDGQKPRTNASAILFALRDGACDARTLKERVSKIKPDAAWPSVEATIYSLAKSKKIDSTKVDGRTIFDLNKVN